MKRFFLFLAPLFLALSSSLYADELGTKSPAFSLNFIELKLSIFPENRKVTVKSALKVRRLSDKVPKSLTVFLPQLLSLREVKIELPNKTFSPKIKRELEKLLVYNLPKERNFLLRINYDITLNADKNYLLKNLMGQISPQNTFFLYGWYPSLRPLADPISGYLLRGERIPYRIEFQSSEISVTSGRLVQRKKLKSGRWVYVYRSLKPVPAALFFADGPYQKFEFSFRRKGGAVTTVELYPFRRSSVSTDGPERVAELVAFADRFYREKFGEPSFERKKRAVWRVVEFEGAGARGYPYTLLIDRRDYYFSSNLSSPIGRIFTKRLTLLHEVAHTWWGNALTGVGSGSNWINEGFSSYSSLKALGRFFGREAELRALRRHIRAFIDGKGSGNLLAPGSFNQLVQLTAYTKGPLVLYELEKRLGREVLNWALRRFFEKFRGKYPTAVDFKAVLERTSGKNLDNFFREWIQGTELPLLSMESYLIKELKGGLYSAEVTLKNSGNISGTAHIAVRFSSGKRRDYYAVVPPGGRKVWRGVFDKKPSAVEFDPDRTTFHGLRWQPKLKLANRLRMEGNYKKSEEIYRKIYSLYPDCGWNLYSWARLKQQQKEFVGAEKLYRKAMSLPPSPPRTPRWIRPWSRFRISEILFERKKFRAAEKLLSQLKKGGYFPYNLHFRIVALLEKIESRSASRPVEK